MRIASPAVALVAVLLASAVVQAGTDTAPGPDPDVSLPFEACGTLRFGLDGNDCWVFITHNGSIYTIENTGRFEDGDAVCVSGVVVYHQCFTVCGEVTGCIFDNSITDAFEGFGTYAQGFECGVLIAGDGANYQINGPIPGGVAFGDPIHVSGTLDAGCLSFCDMVCIQDAVVREVFSGAGTLGPGPQGCPLFTGDGGELFLLEHLDGFTPGGGRVYVTGAVEPESLLCLPPIWPGLLDNEIHVLFEGCGEIGPGPQGCLTFVSEAGPSFYLTGSIDGLGLFDRFELQGAVMPNSSLCFPVTGTALEVTASAECNDADVNGDGHVDVGDLVAVITAWGPCPGCFEDVNDDEVVNVEDLVAVIVAWGA